MICGRWTTRPRGRCNGVWTRLGRLSRNEFDGLLDAMVRAGLIEIEEAEFEKDGEVIRFRKVRLTEAGLEVRPATPLELLISDGIVEGLAGG